MKIQEILTYIIVAATAGYALWSLIGVIRAKTGDDKQPGCSSSCSCDAVKMREELLKNKSRKAV